MIVTATEFKTNFGKYLDLISKEDIFITRNGKNDRKGHKSAGFCCRLPTRDA